MRVTIQKTFLLLFLWTSYVQTGARLLRRSLNNQTLVVGDDPTELQKRDGTKYSYTDAHWEEDVRMIREKGVDAIALNLGRSEWQRTQIDRAYAAAQRLGTGLKLFLSFDFTEMDCHLSDFVDRVNRYKDHPNQFKVNGKPMVSSYEDCLGNAGWAALKAQTNAYVMPFISGIEGRFHEWPALDSWYCWGCAWPQNNHPKNTDDDYYYLSQLGSRYATTVSMWMYTHYNYKNFYLRGDDWLINNRWEQLIAMRDSLTFVELVTWNDYGESDYFGPIKGEQPTGTTWANGFPHTAWYDMSEYYMTAFKTGSYPPITQDVIYFWARPHPAHATASGDNLPKPRGWDWTEDSMWAAVFATAPSTVTLKCGSSQSTFDVGAGVTKLKIPLAAGKMTVQMVRNGVTMINYTPQDYTYILNPVFYNYNAWVGSATASVSPSPSSTSSSTSYTPTTTSTTPTSTSSTPTTTSTTPTTTSPPAATTTAAGVAWGYKGCYEDSPTRILSTGPLSDSSLTINKCLTRCQSNGFSFAGVQYGVECFCGSSIRAGAVIKPETDCSKPCGGNANEKCGEGYRMNIYQALSTVPSSSSTSTSPAPSPTTSWTNYGCVAEGTSGSRRALTGASFQQSNMTPQRCQTLCAAYQFAGTEYGNECHCGNTIQNNGATGNIIAASNCPMNCAGDSTQKCGGDWTLGVYSKSWSSAGCFTDSSSRVLRGFYVDQGGMTTEKCVNMCAVAGYSMAGTQYGRECLCGNQVHRDGGAGFSVPLGECNMPCHGNSSQMCGAGWRINLYLRPGTTIN
ncbi:hypothetical protein CVT24_011636 [Panaeolus cyanescens]|uniref:WSC domain-containing protein n=1 Tax=Panaeolus cyanescens TaxID=181874 RepID=A0A409YH21_9AGAR|nr:hypothetical protein CVT24_011636 [Panaeolus cyanescens]